VRGMQAPLASSPNGFTCRCPTIDASDCIDVSSVIQKKRDNVLLPAYNRAMERGIGAGEGPFVDVRAVGNENFRRRRVSVTCRVMQRSVSAKVFPPRASVDRVHFGSPLEKNLRDLRSAVKGH